jgi:hypothetical protein
MLLENDELRKNSMISFPELSNDYEVIYYNAWENDFHTDALDVFLIELVKAVSRNKTIWEKDNDNLKKIVKGIFSIMENIEFEVLPGGKLSFKEVRKAFSENVVVSREFVAVTERREKIKGFLDEITKEKITEDEETKEEKREERRLLVILDELDRCKPTFAVDTLELIKHFFVHPRVTFLISCNKVALASTVKCYYGNEFDGYRYLNRLFTLELNLPKVDIKKYVNYHFGKTFQEYIRMTSIMIHVALFFLFTLREINTLSSILSTFMKYWREPLNLYSEYDKRDYFMEWVILIYILGLKIHNYEKYEAFIGGKGFSQFKEFLEGEEIYVMSTLGLGKDPNGETSEKLKGIEEVKRIYDIITKINIDEYSEEYRKNEKTMIAFENMLEMLSMMSSKSEYSAE